MTAQEWLDEFARLLGLQPPSDEEVEQLLSLAAMAAHASERTAAPVACWIAAATPRTLPEVLELARQIG